MKPGDIVLIRFPQADLLEGKLRPALALALAPGSHPDLLLALITSRDYQAVPHIDEILDPAEDDFAQTGLKTRRVYQNVHREEKPSNTKDTKGHEGKPFDF